MAESHAIGISVASYTHGGERDRDRERQRDREKEEKSVKPISLHCNMKRVIGHQQQKNTILCPFFLVCSSEVYCDQTNRYILKVHSISISSVYLLTHLFKKSSLSLTLSLYLSLSLFLPPIRLSIVKFQLNIVRVSICLISLAFNAACIGVHIACPVFLVNWFCALSFGWSHFLFT